MSLDPLRKQFGHWFNPSPLMGDGLGGGALGSMTPTLTRPHRGGGEAPGDREGGQ